MITIDPALQVLALIMTCLLIGYVLGRFDERIKLKKLELESSKRVAEKFYGLHIGDQNEDTATQKN